MSSSSLLVGGPILLHNYFSRNVLETKARAAAFVPYVPVAELYYTAPYEGNLVISEQSRQAEKVSDVRGFVWPYGTGRCYCQGQSDEFLKLMARW